MNEMLIPLLYVSAGINCLVIFCAGAFWGMRVMDRLGGRLKARLGTLQEAQILEARRLKHDYGRTTAVRENAGPPAKIVRAMAPHKKTRNRYNRL